MYLTPKMMTPYIAKKKLKSKTRRSTIILEEADNKQFANMKWINPQNATAT
jgi:hypothetical protein